MRSGAVACYASVSGAAAIGKHGLELSEEGSTVPGEAATWTTTVSQGAPNKKSPTFPALPPPLACLGDPLCLCSGCSHKDGLADHVSKANATELKEILLKLTDLSSAKKKKAGLISFKKENISKPCSYREIFHVYFPDFQSTL